MLKTLIEIAIGIVVYVLVVRLALCFVQATRGRRP